MENTCKSCQTEFSGNFCSNCGQKKYTRIDRKYLIDEFQYSILHTNKGFFYTVKNLLKNPGKTARDYIDGNRSKHYKPILLAFVLATFSAFLSFKVIGVGKIFYQISDINKSLYTNSKNTAAINAYYEGYNNTIQFIQSYNNFFMVLLIPLFSAFSYLAFKKWGHNFYEHVVMNAFFQAYYTLITIVFIYPLYYFTKDNLSLFAIISILGTIIVPFIYTWFFKGFYSANSYVEIFARVLLVFAMTFVLYVIVIIAATAVIIFKHVIT